MLCPSAMPLLSLTQECLDAAHHKWPGVEPGSKRKDRPRSIQVFNNLFIEKVFGRAHWVTPIIWFGPVIAYGIYQGVTDAAVGLGVTLALFAGGWLIWTLMMKIGITATSGVRACTCIGCR